MTDLGDGRSQLTMSHALPTGLAFADARLNLFELCDGAMNGTYFATDSDGDATVDAFDLFPNDAAEYQDSDGDGIGDSADPDDDNDGVEDALDAFPTDPLRVLILTPMASEMLRILTMITMAFWTLTTPSHWMLMKS